MGVVCDSAAPPAESKTTRYGDELRTTIHAARRQRSEGKVKEAKGGDILGGGCNGGYLEGEGYAKMADDGAGDMMR